MKRYSNRDSSDSVSIRQRVFQLHSQKPWLTAKPICKILGLSYEKHGPTVANYRSQARHNYVFGSPQKPHRTVFATGVGGVVMSEGRRCRALGFGWSESGNRNGMLRFESGSNHVHWFRNGRVMLYLNPASNLGGAKELFWRAFKFLGEDVLLELVDGVKPFSRHRVFDLEERLPKAEIKFYRDSHGLNIKLGDSSHPTCVEVEETVPFWLGRFGNAVEGFADNIDSHRALIEEWREEARERRNSGKKPRKFEIHALVGDKAVDMDHHHSSKS